MIWIRGDKKQSNMSTQKNFYGSSKSMEADEILKMVEYLFLHNCFIIDVTVSADDKTMRAVIKHP